MAKIKSNDTKSNTRVSSSSRVSLLTRNPQLLNDSANVYFSDIAGTSIPSGFAVNPNSSYGKFFYTAPKLSFPGVMGLHMRPTLLASDETSAVNVAMRKLYSYVRHANSGHSNYEAPDLFLYVLALSSAYKLLATMQRVYGIARLYTFKNRYYPAAFMNVLNTDLTEVQSSLAQFRLAINVFADKLSSFALPASMPFVYENLDLLSRIYVDEESTSKAQAYLFCQNEFYVYNPKLNTNGGGLKVVSIEENEDTGTHRVQDYIDLSNKMMDVLMKDEDINIMSGDLLKAYGTENLLAPQPIGEDYTAEVVYDPEVLTMISNIVPVYLTNLDVTQENGRLKCEPRVLNVRSAGSSYLTPIITLEKDNPTPADIISATRFTVATEVKVIGSGAATPEFHLVTPVTATIGDIEIVRVAPNNDGFTSTYWLSSHAESLNLLVALHEHLEVFKYFPAIYRVTTTYAGADQIFTVTNVTRFGDLDNYAAIPGDTLRRMHEICMLSLFDVSTIARAPFQSERRSPQVRSKNPRKEQGKMGKSKSEKPLDKSEV